MKRWFALGGVALLVMLTPASALAKPKSRDKLVTGPISGTTTVDLAAGTATGEGTARLSHIGRSRYRLDGTFVSTSPTSASVSGTGSLVAANGDRLFGTYTGTLTEIVPLVSSHSSLVFTVTGGTGRFEHATGSLTSQADNVVISSDPATGVFVNRDTGTVSGRIHFARSHRGHRCGGRHP